MKVSEVSITMPLVKGIDKAEDLIVYEARVSNPENQLNLDTAPKLLQYLVKHKHWSPFEMVDYTVEITTSRYVAAQILRHRSFFFQEFCISGDSLITLFYPDARKCKKVTIESLYKRYKSSYWNRFGAPRVKVYDEDSKTFKSVEIKEVFQTGVKPVYKVTLANGKNIKSTLDHKFLTKEGFKKLSDLAVGNYIAVNGIACYQDKDWLAKAKEESLSRNGVQYIADKANVSYHTIRKWLKIHSLQFTKSETSLYTEAWNKGLPTELQPNFGKKFNLELRLNLRKASRKGSDSNLYTGNTISWRKQVANECIKHKALLAVRQNINFKDLHLYEVDHILPVYLYPELAFDINNLQLLTKEEHKLKSVKESIESRKTIGYSHIVSIEYVGEEMTYDLEVNHKSHNYVANNIITHNSQRYANAQGIEPISIRRQAKNNRQSSEEEFNPIVTLHDQQYEADELVAMVTDLTFDVYEALLDAGVSRETARSILPLATSTTMYMKGSVRSWMHYLPVRMDPHTQLEHRQVANEIRELFKKRFPVVSEAMGYE
jgi:thymidylate synthase (FAD)